MRKIILIFSFFLYPFLGTAQDFAPIGATWFFTRYCICPEILYQKLISTKDTLILGINCKKITAVGHSQSGEETFSKFGYFYSDSNSVFYLWEDQFYLLYDFSKEAGDTFYVKAPSAYYQFFPVKILSKADTVINNISLRKLQVKSLDPLWVFDGSIIERIGCSSYILPYLSVVDPGDGGPLRCYSDSLLGEYIEPLYASTELPCDYFFSSVTEVNEEHLVPIFPNPTSTTITLSLPSNQNAMLSIFNLLGEKVKEEKVTGKQVTMDVSSLPQGLYLVRTENRVVGEFVKE